MIQDQGVDLGQDCGRVPSAPGSRGCAPEPASAVSAKGADPSRDWRGRFLPKLRWTPEGSREWLIWSKYWNAWHRRDPQSGGACGYTSDISQAGMFPRDKAASYNDDRNRPYHFSEKSDEIGGAIRHHEEAIARLRASAIEARRAAALDAVHESAVRDSADAQNLVPESSQ